MDDDQVRNGNAMIIDPHGEIIAETNALGEDVVVGLCVGKIESSAALMRAPPEPTAGWSRARRAAGDRLRLGRRNDRRQQRHSQPATPRPRDKRRQVTAVGTDITSGWLSRAARPPRRSARSPDAAPRAAHPRFRLSRTSASLGGGDGDLRPRGGKLLIPVVPPHGDNRPQAMPCMRTAR